MSAWNPLVTSDDWSKHCEQQLRTHSLAADQVNFGKGPNSYPCLVATIYVPPSPGGVAKMVSAYVYVDDAKALLKMAGVGVQDLDAPKSPNQEQFNRWLSAQMLTVVWFLVQTGICKPEQFETKMLEKLDMVDAAKGEQVEKLKNMLLAKSD